MSDSHPKENNNKGKDEKSSDAGISGKTRTLPKPVLLMAILAAIGILYFGWVLTSEFLTKTRLQETTSQEEKTPVISQPEISDTSDIKDTTEPISILPPKPEGITILEKQAEIQNQGNSPTMPPVATDPSVARGFAMDLGAAQSFLDLTNRFADIVQGNGPENFNKLDPRVILSDTVNGLEARLLVGPFETKQAAEEACEVLILPKEIQCAGVPFQGELIARE